MGIAPSTPAVPMSWAGTIGMPVGGGAGVSPASVGSADAVQRPGPGAVDGRGVAPRADVRKRPILRASGSSSRYLKLEARYLAFTTPRVPLALVEIVDEQAQRQAADRLADGLHPEYPRRPGRAPGYRFLPAVPGT